MPWGAAIGAGLSLLSDKGGGGGGQTASKDPWAAAAPWLQANLASGQALQGQYAANPFSDTQKQAYMNQFGNSDYARQLTGSILGQMNGFQPFDRNNPTARPQMFQFPQQGQGGQGLLAGGSMAATNPFMSPVLQPPAQAAPAPAPSNNQGAEGHWVQDGEDTKWIPGPPMRNTTLLNGWEVARGSPGSTNY